MSNELSAVEDARRKLQLAAMRAMLALDDDARHEVMGEFCRGCGCVLEDQPEKRCYCERP